MRVLSEHSAAIVRLAVWYFERRPSRLMAVFRQVPLKAAMPVVMDRGSIFARTCPQRVTIDAFKLKCELMRAEAVFLKESRWC